MNELTTIPSARETLLSFLVSFGELPPDEVAAIADQIVVRSFKKGDVLVHEGEVVTQCYFVLKGCLRQFRLLDGIEKTTEFYTQEQAAVLFTSQTSQTCSDSYLVCVEDTLVIVGEMQQETSMYQQYPVLEGITRQMMERDFGRTQDRLAQFMASTPENRYLNLLQTRPDLLQRVPQHQLASYLGVTPESLSRIRKRITKAAKPV
jgi:CRP-like cAMP-binding protein